ncbi:MAG: hydrogenase iron-sulfur subunit [Desulfobacterales bacterium]|nr:hydrogenase iron-sulfur subunit [Desulfobacterales bacterium]
MTTAKNTREMEKIEIATDVLVIGGGYTGLKAADSIAETGYRVILADQKDAGTPGQSSLFGLQPDFQNSLDGLKDAVKANSRVEFLPEARIKTAAGVPGDFTIRLTSDGTEIEKKVGAIVVATDIVSTPLNHIYGLDLSDRVISLSDFEEKLSSADFKKKLDKDKQTVAFLAGFAQDGNPLLMKRILDSVLAVEEAGKNATAYVYINDIKVAGDNLERLYKAGRDAGAIYFKSTQPPEIKQQNDGPAILLHDPVIRSDIEAEPDYLVIEEAMTPGQVNSELADILRIDLGPMGFLQTDNVHRFPVHSNREGIYVIGSTRDIQDLSDTWTDVENAVLDIKQLLGDGTKEVPKFCAVVDREKCVTCLTCYRCCPHGAIYWDDKAVISPVACQACGICASECPQEAIQVTGYSDDELLEQIRTEISGIKNGDPKILAFCCENSALEAGRTADLFHYNLPKGLRLIRVPCAGKVDIHYVLSAFIEGADGVLVMACHPGNCKSETGTTFARWRINNAYQMLEETGIDKNRLEFVTLASNMAPDFAKIAVEMEKRIG